MTKASHTARCLNEYLSESDMPKRLELKPTELRRVCEPSRFTFKETSELPSLDQVIGQERAVQAIEFGLNMRSPGYNIFVTGRGGHR